MPAKTPASNAKASRPRTRSTRKPADPSTTGSAKPGKASGGASAGKKPAKGKPSAERSAAASAKSKTTASTKPLLKKPSGLDLAAKVLGESDRPLSAKEIAERVIAAGWSTTGKTPHATLYSAMLREIKGKGPKSRFVKEERGRFAAAMH